MSLKILRVLVLGGVGLHSAQALADPARCIAPAAQHHGVNKDILRAIIAVESGFRPDVVTSNKNGSIDVGLAGINSIHFPELAKHGITPEKLKDPCVSTYVAAWKVRKKMQRWGNNWFGIAAYHSETPYFNARYQILLHNKLVDFGVMAGPKLRVPPLRPQPK